MDRSLYSRFVGGMPQGDVPGPRDAVDVGPAGDASSRVSGGFDIGWLAFLGVAIVATVVLLVAGRSLTFFFDEWTWITDRRDLSVDTFLVAHNEHLVLFPAFLYSVLFHTVGLVYWPYRLLIIVTHVGVAALLFAYLRHRLQWGVAWCAATIVLFFGAAYQVILWPFQIQYTLSLFGVLGLLLMIDRRTTRADLAGAALSVLALASSGLGVPLVAVVGLELLLRRQWRRLWVVVLPLVLYGIWYARYGSRTGANAGLVGTTRWVVEFAGASIGGVLGLGQTIGEILLVPFLVVLVWGVWRADAQRRPRVITVALMPISYWVVIAVGRSGMQDPDTSRYLYAGGILAVLAVGECLAGTRTGRIGASAVAVITAVAVTLGTIDMFRGGDELRVVTRQTLATVSAIDIGTRSVDPAYARDRVPPPQDGAPLVAAFDALGSIVLTPVQIRAMSEENRQQADGFLVAAVGMRPVPATPPSGPPPLVLRGGPGVASGTSCVRIEPGPAGVDVEVEPQTGHLLIDPAGAAPVDVWIRSFADGWFGGGVPYVTIPGDTPQDIPTPRTAAPRWRVRLQSSGAVVVCGTEARGG